MTRAGDGAGRRRGVGVRYRAELGRAICERVAAGEVLYRVLAEAGMPTPQTVARWTREKPDFAAELSQARMASGPFAGGRPGGGGVWRYCEATAEAVCERMCEGESLTAIARDPTMPCLSTLFHWRRRIPEFEARIAAARRIQAERFCDLGWEICEAATPETAYLTHVRLAQLR